MRGSLWPVKPMKQSFPAGAGFDQCGVRAFVVENAMRVFEPNDFMVSHEVDTVDAKATKRFVQLSCGFDF